jgi:putative drug exporter of the RND superfamily
MEVKMNNFGKFIFRNKKTIIFLWIIMIAILGFFALKLPSVLSGNGFEYKGEYQQTRKILDEEFGRPKSTILVLFEKEKKVSKKSWESYINDSLEKASKIPDVDDVISPFEQPGMLKDKVAYGALLFEKESGSLNDTITKLRSILKEKDGMSATITGEPVIVKDLNQASQDDLAKAEMIGLPIALVVLILAFGSLVAASLPIIIGIISITSTMGIVYFFSHSFDLTIFILNIVPMIGLALSIDFALLIINRFKEEISKGSVEEAVAITVGTAGRSVVFSGMCVFIGLLGLMFIDVDIFKNVALGGVTVVLVSALSAITFLPALLSMIGKRIHALTILKVDDDRPGIWSKFAHLVMKRPVIMALLALIILIAGLIPVKDMELTVPGIDALPPTYDSRIAYDKYVEKFIEPTKSLDNTVVVIMEMEKDIFEKESIEKAQMALDNMEQDKNVHMVESVFSMVGMEDSDQLLLALSQPDSPFKPVADQFMSGNKMLATVYLKENLSTDKKREWVSLWSETDLGVKTYLGGSTKFEQEIFDEVANKTPRGLALILISTFLILMVAFRSLLIPLKAIIMNILSLSCTFGIVVWIFQEGHLGMDPVSITLMLPVFVFSLVFGLSMDYEVFLISRIHETYLETRNNNEATLHGLISTSKIITSAAAIMIVVTGAFAFTGVTPVKQMGVGIALAIFIDATIIRMILVPSLMKLLGDWNWWFFGLKQKQHE